MGYPAPQYAAPQYGAPARPRPNPVAGILLLLGGAAGVLQAFLPWGQNEFASVTGLDASRTYTAIGQWDATVVGYGIWAILVGGALCALGGIALMVRGNRGLAGFLLFVALVMTAPAVLFLVEALSSDSYSLADTAVGFYLFFAAGVVSLLGAIVGVARRG